MDDKNKRGGQDRSRISTSEDYEVQYWAQRLGVTAEELKKAVKDSGSNNPDDVSDFLKKQKQKNRP